MSPSPTTLKKIIDVLKQQDKRISHLEKELKVFKNDPQEELEIEEPQSTPKERIHISPTVVITTVGIIGIVIGLISFFMYAISNNWIGPIAQISIGVVIGLGLFVSGYQLYDKHSKWAVTCFGGAIFVEFVSIGFGVWYYSVINEYFAFVLLLLFLAIGIVLSLKYDSLVVAYFSIAGGIITPVVSDIVSKPLFTVLFLVLLAVGVLVLSHHKQWISLRMVSFIAILLYEFNLFNSFGSSLGLSAVASIFFLAVFFFLFNISSLVFSVRNDKAISALDISLLNLNTFFSAILFTSLFFSGVEVVSTKVFGAILLVISFFFLLEMYYLKTHYATNKHLKATLYSLFSSGIILINIGLILIFSTESLLNLIILALPQWLLYSYLSTITDDETYYSVCGYIFLGIGLLWWLYHLVDLPSTIGKATYVILMMLVFLGALVFFVRKDILRAVHGFVVVVAGYAFIYSLTAYIQLITQFSGDVITTLLSGLWLAYTLTLYIQTRETGKLLSTLSLILLILTLIKIAFFDLTRLDGVVRIIGFIVFGVVLLIGGYLLKK